ncbi:endo alpha-1,4 polygalactosaminidase (plasmid) [Streptomyces sp. HUAS 31]|uniref:endo alpha-1,4 polygalactosaminidase n=1 Tax=Streptomyces TaxID=1883 RepID=UPI002304E4EA|nr:endo alpha-1,4 polygalactosaminidase [Streptomyces sp. HUAS 31]WCE02442.1 endo alpha-1,4 polygalactosaminidase [Streptomyces sp. HUAS 31]
MRAHRRSRTGVVAAGLAVAAALGIAAALLGPARSEAAPDVVLPPVNADFDYQIGGAYPPPDGVRVVSRDVKESPAKGLYNICYVNAFQTQQEGDTGGPQDWDQDLLLRDSDGDAVIDPDWDEAILDISSAGKRERIAARIGAQIDQCASKGFDAVEPDNYDTFTRDVVDGRLTAEHAQAYMRLLSERAHGEGLAVGQKNTVELADSREANGLDFAIAEECGDPRWNECGDYLDAFGDNVILVEYTDAGMGNACDYADRVSVVRRDVGVAEPGSGDYVRETC